ncbi:hypothetical protein [Salinimicrobium oceani]|uniref:Secreted protein n=1 Tax=Salinimicrobium oceani TaxID=2722702 RepID=A0ABX1CTH1_9FLAO|nr:hypothetical protein [Salinimicrobium oceani]NJW51588.1 hypothetical protein [Salinimicrobium oceani]
MGRLIKFLFCLIGMIMIIPSKAVAQAPNAQVYNKFDELVNPSNTGVFNGIGYEEVHRTINENHKFFLTTAFVEGTLYYNGQPYFSQLLKYNVFDDLLLIQAKDRGNLSLFQLIKEKVDGFEINGHYFTNIKSSESEELNGFYEVLAQNGEMQLLKKHARNINQLIKDRVVYYEFKPKEMGYLLKHSDKLYEFNSKREIVKLFPDAEKSIGNYFSSERKTLKINRDQFMVNLFRNINLENSSKE